VISNLGIDLEQCQYLPESYFDKTMKSAEDEWKICSPRLIRLGHIIAKFRHISSEDCVIHCLEHAHSIATVSLMIADVKTVGNATNLERFIGGVKNDFEAALLIADSEIVSLVDEFALEIAKDLEKVNRRNE
jgi:hypothetical protein